MIELPNAQHTEHKDYHKDGSLEIVDLWRTIQGEGPYVGRPAVFLRLAGCNLQCPLCDTDYTTNRVLRDEYDIAQAVANLTMGTINLVVITGGEPFRQNITLLTRRLIFDYDLKVQVETNGTIDDPNFPWLHSNTSVVCSPKLPNVAGRMGDRVQSWKYIVEAGHVNPHDGLPTSVLGKDVSPYRPYRMDRLVKKGLVFLQPQDNLDPKKNKDNIDAAVASCLTFGYRLSLQIHKIIEVK